MTVIKRKRIMAWILLGALLAGSLSPISANAEEISGTSQILSENEPDVADEKEPDEEEIPEATENTEDITDKNPADSEKGEENPGNGTDIVTAPEGSASEGSQEDTADKDPESTETDKKDSVSDNDIDEGTGEETPSDKDETETDEKNDVSALASDRQITANILSEYNSSFEGVGTDGALYWWNGPNWNQEGVSRKAYEDGEQKPAEDCGDYYLEVGSSTGTKSEAQINNEKIASLIKPEITYEFTYWAKLLETQESGPSGKVELSIVSQNSSFGSQSAASFTFDQTVELDAAQWKQISGTFRIPANASHESVHIKFTGVDGISFCVDDLRVAALEDENIDYGDNLVKNPYFAESDLSVWSRAKGAAEIETGTSAQAIFDDVATYGVIKNRTANSDCFAQDMTGILESGKSYSYSFYVMLDAADYANATAENREVSFAPYVKNANGESNYWGPYSTGVLDKGECTRQIPAGEWVKFEGEFNPQFEGEAQELVIRIIEQGPDWGGNNDREKGSYYVTGVSIREQVKPVKEIEWDIPDLKDYVSSSNGIGANSYTGTAISLSEISDKALMDLVEKHFNAVTIGNEMKMDALFAYHDGNNTAPGFETVTWTRADGTTMSDYKVPTLDYSRADKMLDKLKAWNEANPNDIIKVRGHVLVWHSQAPEWFFHEDWDKSKPDVSAEVMDARQEWYIKTVLEHFTGAESPYKDMFYGWDVVNEAVSDGTGTYRNADEKSSWWRVYGSEAYIVNAFRYANKYAPANIELYYNDYNECVGSKISGIEKLLTEVKSHESDANLPTRISGMGMQSHHNFANPTANQIKDAAVRYGKIVGKVQLTELDIKASNEFDGTDATLQDEYTRQAYRYKEIYDVMREVDAMDGIDVNGITVWGVIDGNSWLQSSNSVGGAADGSKRQVPLLFDDDYKAKPAFYAFVNAEELEPYIRNITVVQAGNADPYANGKSYAIQGIDAEFIPVWTDTELKVRVTVSDTTVDEADSVKLYLDWNKSASEGAFTPVELKRADCQSSEEGYTAEFVIPKEMTPVMGFGLDIVVSDNGQNHAFNDLTMIQDTSSKYYASAVTKPYMSIGKAGSGMITIDGTADPVWEQTEEIKLVIRTGTTQASVAARLLWDEQYLYVLADVTDGELDSSSKETHEQDSLEVFIDENNHKSDGYEEDDKQYRINYRNEQSFNGPKCKAENIRSAAVVTDTGYRIEAAFKWTDITPAVGNMIGIELQINDAAGGKRIGTVSWYDESGQGWSSPGVFGTATLGELTQEPEVPVVKEELNSLIAECEALKQEDYTADSWEPFAKALEEARAASANPDISQEEIEKIYHVLDAAKAGLCKSGGSEPVNKGQLEELISKCETLEQNDYTKESWEIYAKALEEARAVSENETATQAEIQNAFEALSKAFNQLQVREGLWAVDIDDITYTGTALKPEMVVYNGRTLLKQGKDYAVTYKNNKEVGIASVIIKGKGNYAGSLTKTFEIVPKNLDEEDIIIPDLYVKAPTAGKSVTPAPVVTRDGKKLTKNQYQVSVVKDKDGNPVEKVTDPGIYLVEVKGVEVKGYTGTREIHMTVLNSQQVLMSAVKVTNIKNKEYTGEVVVPEFTVTYGGNTLIQGQDYSVICDSREVGTATAVIKGIGEKYAGEKTITFKITGITLKAKDVKLENATGIVYTGSAIEPVVTVAGAEQGSDYIVSYDKNTEVGTAAVTVKGIGKYAGTVKKSFKIAAFDIRKNPGNKISYNTADIKAAYRKGGSKLEEKDLNITFGGVSLKEGVDYTLTYSSNKKAGTAASVKIKGKGNFKGVTDAVSFTVEVQDLANLTNISAADVLRKNAKKYDRVNPVIKDVDGKALKKGTDYTITGYTREDGTAIEGQPEVGDTIRVTVEGKNNYKGTAYADFRIIENNMNLSKAKVQAVSQSYTGKEIRLSGKDLTVTMKIDGETKTLQEGVDYEIVENGYSKNINKGTGKMTIRGIYPYGGTKTVSFKIVGYDLESIAWYSRLYNRTMSWFGDIFNK